MNGSTERGREGGLGREGGKGSEWCSFSQL